MKYYFLLLTFLLIADFPYAAVIARPLNIVVAEAVPREIIVVNQQIWYLTANGEISIYDYHGVKIIIPSVQKINAKHIANDGNDVVAQVGNNLQRWTSADATWHEIGELKTTVFALIVNSQKQLFAITPKGILDVGKHTFQMPSSSPNNQIRQLNTLSVPATYFMDAQDNLWLGYGYGEWGGNIFTYSTNTDKFINLYFNKFQINLHPIKAFFQLKSDVGVSTGLQHMMNSGSIGKFHGNSYQIIYDSETDIDTSSQNNRWASLQNIPYIGPATFELDTEQIYFYSNKGVFTGKLSTDLSRLRNWKLVFTTKLHWRNGQPDAVGSPMNVLKMLSLGNGKLVLLTQNDGVGIWDGTSFKLLQ